MNKVALAVEVGALRARPGERVKGFLTVNALTPAIELPVTIVNGAAPGPTLVVTAGIHGGEYPPIEAARRLAAELDPVRLAGCVIIAHIANPVAFRQRCVFVSGLDEKNLNRAFPGAADGSPTERLAHALFEQVIRKGDLYVDLHGGDMIEQLTPFAGVPQTEDNPRQMQEAARLARAYGVKFILAARTAGSTYVSAARAGIPALLAESGELGLLREPDVQVHLRGLANIMREFGMLPGSPEPPAEPQVRLRESVAVRTEHGGLAYPRVAAGDRVEAGQLLATITDLFGENPQPVTAPVAGYVLYMLNTLAVNPGDLLFAVGVPE